MWEHCILPLTQTRPQIHLVFPPSSNSLVEDWERAPANQGVTCLTGEQRTGNGRKKKKKCSVYCGDVALINQWRNDFGHHWGLQYLRWDHKNLDCTKSDCGWHLLKILCTCWNLTAKHHHNLEKQRNVFIEFLTILCMRDDAVIVRVLNKCQWVVLMFMLWWKSRWDCIGVTDATLLTSSVRVCMRACVCVCVCIFFLGGRVESWIFRSMMCVCVWYGTESDVCENTDFFYP